MNYEYVVQSNKNTYTMIKDPKSHWTTNLKGCLSGVSGEINGDKVISKQKYF